ncbi:MAG: PAS domain S-box protein [Pseudorhodoplanes sp.]|nr:PAS domain S-box protein [Pseudorhodoplanes sp.]
MHSLFGRQLAKATKPNGEVDLDVLGALVSAAYDETERDRMRMDRSMSLMIEEVDQARARLLDAFEVMPEGLALFDSENRYVLWNRRYAEMHADVFDNLAVGMRFEDVVSAAVAKGRYPEAVGREEDWLAERFLSHGQARATREYHLPGDRWIRVDERRTADGGSIGVRVDITDLKRREESFRLLFEANPIPMWIWDHETFRYLAVNKAAIEHYGYSREQFLDLTLFDTHLVKDHDALREITRTRKSGDRGFRNWSHVKADGSVAVATVYGKFWAFEGREASLVAAIDCTERNRTEDELRRTREFLNTIVENVPATIIVKDPKVLSYVLVNRAGEQYYGLSREAIIGKTAHEILEKDSAEIVAALDRKALATLQPVFDEHSIVTPGGGARTSTSKRIPILNADGTPRHLLVVIEDVTRQKTIERQLQHVQKMEAVGSLSGGIAHDFNNLLTVIIGNLDLLKDDIVGNLAAEQKLGVILDASLHGAELTHQLLAFSRRQPLRTDRAYLNDVIAKTTRLMGRTLGESIAIELKTAADTWPVQIDAHQLEAAILNIAINARDAMPTGGKLTILTRNIHLTSDELPLTELSAGDYVVIEISDTGEGISADVLNRVFEPFFTTKALGKGTGLGLSMVYGFVKQSGGHVTVRSEPGKGTTFTLYFPRAVGIAAQSLVSQGERSDDTRSTTARHEVILAVDDNLDVRATTVKQLQLLGYRVIEAGDARAALEILDGAETIDLLFTDIVMPGGFNGKQLAIEARKRRPGLKVLFTSGFPGNPENEDSDLSTDIGLLAKPYRRSDLELAVRESLSPQDSRAA